MARQIGKIPFVGRIGNLIYYKRNDQYYVRSAGSISKERVKEAPEFENTRKLNCEFAGCASIGKMFRLSMGDLLEVHADTFLSPRVNGLFNRAIQHGKGAPGSRMVEIRKNKEVFQGFQFRKKVNFTTVFASPVRVSANRSSKEIKMTIHQITPSSFQKMRGISHYRLFLKAVAFSDMKCDKRTKKYKPVTPSLHRLEATRFSDAFSPEEKVENVTLEVKLPVAAKIPASVGVFVIAGIQFFKEEHGVMYPITTRNCMMIADVI